MTSWRDSDGQRYQCRCTEDSTAAALKATWAPTKGPADRSPGQEGQNHAEKGQSGELHRLEVGQAEQDG